MSVTNDVTVLKKMSFKKGLFSAELASVLGLTVFQITARLASMEKRELVKRDKQGRWFKLISWKVAEAQQKEEASKKAIRVAAWKAGLPPATVTDEGVPTTNDTKGWSCRYTPYAEERWVTVFRNNATGEEFVRAEHYEKADLIRTFDDLPKARLVRFKKGNRWFKAVEEYHKMLEAMLEEEGVPA